MGACVQGGRACLCTHARLLVAPWDRRGNFTSRGVRCLEPRSSRVLRAVPHPEKVVATGLRLDNWAPTRVNGESNGREVCRSTGGD